jgi:CubicO group peptidase (beta-lactamase class C family)
MTDMSVIDTAYDFSAIGPAMQRYVDNDILSGVSWAVLKGRDLVDLGAVGLADREAGTPLGTDHIFRIFSNSKLVTSCAILLLMEEGRLKLDDPIEQYIPELGNRRVLRPGATDANDTEPANGPITIRHLLTHSAGLSYGLLDPGSLIFNLYTAAKVNHPGEPLSAMIDALADLPLIFHPGTSFEYSVATDVLGRLVEVISGQRFGDFLQQRIFTPLGMVDTGFTVPADKRDRLAAYYAGASLTDPMQPGLTRTDNAPYPGAYLQDFPRQSGGGGLASTLSDMIALIRALIPGENTLLKPETMALLGDNQLADGVNIRFPNLGEVPGKGYGLIGSVTMATLPVEPAAAVGEIQWGGIAGTHWWISRENDLAGLLMTQRQMAFWHPFSFEFKNLVYKAVGA